MYHPIKSLGQNFLKDKNILEKIIRAIDISQNDLILEIGPGTGALTDFIFKAKPKKFIGVDLDKRSLDLLSDKYQDLLKDDYILIKDNILDFDIHRAFNLKNDDKIKVCGNIPYNITAGIIFKLIENRNIIEKAVIMVQKEVAQRLIAQENTKAYGILSVILSVCSKTQVLFDVSPNCFYPKPKVTSSVVEIYFNKNKLDFPLNAFIEFVKIVFNNRRKMIKKSIIKYIESKKLTLDLSTIDKYFTLRAEQLSPENFVELFGLINRGKKIA